MSSDFPGDHEPAQQNADPDGQVPPPDLGKGTPTKARWWSSWSAGSAFCISRCWG